MRIFYYLLLLIIPFKLEAQQVKKIDCCQDVTPKSTIIINENTSSGTTSSTTSTNPGNGVFNFELKSSLNTSAGVYNSSGVLVRMLWGGVRYDTGCYNAVWGGLLDDGTTAPLGDYTVRVLTNNVVATHEGGIGSTSGGTVNGFGQITGFCFVNGRAYYGDFFAEGGQTLHYIDLNNINQGYAYLPGFSSIMIGNCTDGIKVYAIAEDQYASPYNNFIIATNVSDNSNYTFSAGTTITAGRGGTLPVSATGLFSDGTAAVTNGYSGIAVQKNGILLFATRNQTNDLLVFNKNSGFLLKTIKTSGANAIAVTSDDAKLWINENTGLNQYRINTDATVTPTGLSLPTGNIGFSISPITGELAVANDATCQIGFYNGNTGILNSTFGRLNGYSGSPAVDNTKFLFHDEKTFAGTPVINFQPDGSFWVRDAGTYRWVHYNADKSYKEYFMYLPSSRSCNIDANIPTSYFSDELEFQIDYSKPLDNGVNGSWKLINCWKPNTNLNLYGKFERVVTLSNGHKYAQGNANLYDLTANGAIYLGQVYGIIEADGSLWNRSFPNEQAVVTKQPLTGFDGNNKPVWGASVTVATTPQATPTSPFYYRNNTIGSSTNPDRYFFYNPIHHNKDLGDHNTDFGVGYHLGAIKTGGNTFDWQASKSTYFDYHGDFPRNGDFDIGNNDYNFQHSENCTALVSGKIILWHVNAEFWQANAGSSGVNISNLFYEDGLPVLTFGKTNFESNSTGDKTWIAINSYSNAITKIGGDMYFIYCDETAWGETRRVKITGLNTIAEQIIPIKITIPITVTPDPSDMMAGLPFKSNTFTGGNGWSLNSNVKALTSLYQYQRDSVDIDVGGTGVQILTRQLNNTASLSSWTLTGGMSFARYGEPAIGPDNYNYLEMVDANGKIITRFNDYANTGNSYYHTTYLNDKIIKQGSPFDGTYPFSKNWFNNFSFSYNAGVLLFKYGSYPAVAITTGFEAGADLSKPVYLRVSQGSPGNQNHEMSLYKVRFVKN